MNRCNPNTEYGRMEQVIQWHERAVLPKQAVNPRGLCFGTRPLGEDDAWLRCDVVLPAWPCLKTTFQRCLAGLAEPGGSSDFLPWLIFVDLLLNASVHSFQMALCGWALARSHC